MDNIAVEASAISCILPLIAFILLALQFYRHSLSQKGQNAVSFQNPEEFPCQMGALISITGDIATKDDFKMTSSRDYDQGPKCIKDRQDQQGKYLYAIGRQAFEIGRYVLQGCNAGLAKMMAVNRQYFATRRKQAALKYGRDQRRRKNPVHNRDWFEPTRLVTIVQGLQY